MRALGLLSSGFGSKKPWYPQIGGHFSLRTTTSMEEAVASERLDAVPGFISQDLLNCDVDLFYQSIKLMDK